jgi:biopolymer transport protein TolQ
VIELVSGETGSISPLALFVQADLIVKAVMIGLILASVLTWAIIISHHFRIKRLARENERFERACSKAEDVDRYYDARGREDIPSARVFAAAVAEWRRSTSGPTIYK